jgi:hypothetical protein
LIGANVKAHLSELHGLERFFADAFAQIKNEIEIYLISACTSALFSRKTEKI